MKVKIDHAIEFLINMFTNERNLNKKIKYKKKIKVLVSVLLMTLNMIAVAANERQRGLLYVLIWTSGFSDPFTDFHPGRKGLYLMDCKFQNCFFTSNRRFFLDPTYYDVILFNAPDIRRDMVLPSKRSDQQIYVFVSTESESNYPISNKFQNFFNYTWSYKLNSDIPYPFFVVRKKRTGRVIGPKTNARWKIPENMKLTSKSVIQQLTTKSTCAAWFVSNCNAISQRLDYVRRLRNQLENLGQQIDIFGKCDANRQCPKNKSEECFELVKEFYYFYLAFENSLSADYVTEKLLTAVNNYAVPVVFGGANYSRFLPDGAYINARLYTPEALAIKMNDIIRHRQDYYDYFKFYRYYTYDAISDSEDMHPQCIFCKFINKDSIWETRRTYALFTMWWSEKH